MNKLNIFIKDVFGENVFSQTFGLTRSFLALGTLLTLIFNSIDDIFYSYTNGKLVYSSFIDSDFSKFNIFYLFGYEYMPYMRYIAIIILLLVISGYFIKLTSLLHWYVVFSFISMSLSVDGGDHIALLLTTFFIPISFLDNRKNHWYKKIKSNTTKNIVASVFFTLMRLQAFGIYFHSGVGKFSHEQWSNGTATYYWFNHFSFGMSQWVHIFLDPIIENFYGVTFLTYGVLFFEILLALLLFMPLKYRKFFFPIAIFFHFGIIIIHGIFTFFFSMATILIIYLLDYRKDFHEFKK